MRTSACRLRVASLLLASACAPKTMPAPVVTAPKFPDSCRPPFPPALADSAAAAGDDRAAGVSAGRRPQNAEREFAAALKTHAGVLSRRAALGYVELARKDAKAALAAFRSRRRARQPALTRSALARTRTGAAGARTATPTRSRAFEAALAADPSLTDVRRRAIEVLKFRDVEQELAPGARGREGRRARRSASRPITAAIASSPDSAFLYRELAAVERQKGDSDGGARALPQGGRARPGRRRVARADRRPARGARRLRRRGAKAYASARRSSRRRRRQRSSMRSREGGAGAACRRNTAPSIRRRRSRARDLAALIGIRLAPLLQPRGAATRR